MRPSHQPHAARIAPLAIKTTQKLRKANGGGFGGFGGGRGGFGTPGGGARTGVLTGGGGQRAVDRRDIGSKTTTIIPSGRFPLPQISMGGGFPTVPGTRNGVPPLVSAPLPMPPPPVPGTVARTQPVSQPTVEPRSPTTIPLPSSSAPGGKPMASLDLGQLALDLGTAYFQNRFAPSYMPPVFSGGFNGGGIAATPAALDVPFVDVIPESPMKGMVFNPAANCGAGKWQKKTRRRRKRLATASDLKDLASLKGIMGTGEAFKVWVATHS